MGMELDIDESFCYDSYTIAVVQQALKGAVMGDMQDYDQLVALMDPSITISSDGYSNESKEDKEAMLVATLRALSEVVSHIDVVHHQSLYTSILGMSIWKCQPVVRDALIDLVVCLAASSGIYLDACLDMLVCHFMPPPLNYKNRWFSLKSAVIGQIFSALQDIADLVPIAPMRLLPIIERRMPSKYAPKAVTDMYVECMLKLEGSAVGEFIGSPLLKAVVDRLVDLDVDIRWDDVLETDTSRGIFDMELEDMDGNDNDTGDIDNALNKTRGIIKDKSTSESLDNLMTIMCNHLTSCANVGRLTKVFETLMESFQKTVLTAHKSKFVQFLMFYACSLDPENSGVKFSLLLRDIFLSNTEAPLIRMSAVSYLASYLSRAKFLALNLVVNILERLVEWCFEYCCIVDGMEKVTLPAAHQVFYSGCQAVMYILCFHLRSVIDDPSLKEQLICMPLEPIFYHALDPLKVCLPSIVEEFLRQAKTSRMFSPSMTILFDKLLDSEPSKTSIGVQRLDMFFPFDPYLLKKSDRFIRPNFNFWSMVRTTYDYSDDEDADEVYEADAKGVPIESNLAFDAGGFDGDEHLELDNEDDLECSMNAMSITPKGSFKHIPGNETTQMPARFRPSTSPDW